MKSKLLRNTFGVLSLLLIISMASCKRQQCPAYGKVTPKTVIDKKHA